MSCLRVRLPNHKHGTAGRTGTKDNDEQEGDPRPVGHGEEILPLKPREDTRFFLFLFLCDRFLGHWGWGRWGRWGRRPNPRCETTTIVYGRRWRRRRRWRRWRRWRWYWCSLSTTLWCKSTKPTTIATRTDGLTVVRTSRSGIDRHLECTE